MTEQERSDLPNPVYPPPFRIEDCLVLPALNRIECGQETHQIEPRVMQVLVCLASRPNEVLSRQMLFDAVWTDSVVCEEALTRTISELRRVFRDDTKTPRVIETIRKGGYRLIAPVTPASAPEPDGPRPLAPDPPPSPPPRRLEPSRPPSRGRPRRAWLLGVGGLAVVTVIFIASWGAKRLTRANPSIPVLTEPIPLTSFPGLELFPALSPDGSMVAFAWAGESPGAGNPLDIHVMKTRNGSPVRLTDLPGSEYFPSWSPDGTEIVFANETKDGYEICTIPVLGGEVRRLARVKSEIGGLDWSPDGQTIAYSAADPSSEIPRIHILTLGSLSRRDLTTPPQHCRGDIEPVFSPDGRSLAFVRINQLQDPDAYVVPLEGGEARALDIGGGRVSGVAWWSQREMIISAASKLDYGLWKVSVDSGERSRLSIPGGRIQRVSLARTSRRLAYEKISFARNILCVDISEAGEFHRRREPLIASTQRQSEPVPSPDGRSIAFVSDRSGSSEIWIADISGDHPRRLTDHQATQMTRPRWSPDGTQIAYSCNADGPSSIYVTELQSQVARRLVPGGPQILGAWSRQGDDLYYQADAPGGWEVWRVHPDGTGCRKVSEAGYTIIDEAVDGRGLFCVKSGEPGIWLLPVDGGQASMVVPGESCRDWQETIVAKGGLCFTRRGKETSTLGFYDLATGRSDSLATLEWYAASLALSPDRSMLLYDCIGKIEVDLMLADVRE